MKGRTVLMGVAALALAMIPRMGAADGDEILAPPSVGVSAGSGYVMAGVGLVERKGVFAPGDIEIDVPGAVEQVLLYWQGRNRDVATPFETTLIVNGVSVTGSQIGISTPPISPMVKVA